MSRARRHPAPSQKHPGYYVCPYCKTGRAVPIAKDQHGQHAYRCSSAECGREFSDTALEQADRERRRLD
jgi:DNA-directed RNA polymerase subunit RPC12/RpoP